MKKKLLLFFTLVSIVCCFFAITLNAAEIPDWTEITKVNGMADKDVFGTDGTSAATSRVLMSDGITYPAYYICKNSTSLGITFTELNTNASKEYAAKDVVRLELPSGLVSTPTAVLKTENGFTALKTVSFSDGFTTLGSYTFKATDAVPSALVYVSLPSTLTSIGESAFIRCASLEELTIPEGVSVIPKEMAYYATSLKKLVLPSTIKEIGASAFRSADLSDGVVIPNGCTNIGNYAFKGSGATKVTLPSTLTTLGTEIFKECPNLVELYSESPIIGVQMFCECLELKDVTLKNTVEIKERAFNNATLSKIESITLPEGLTTVGAYALPRSSLTTLVLPSTLTNIGDGAFKEAKSLTKVVVLGSELGSNMFSACSSLKEFVVTENFKTFGSGAFNNVSQESFISYYTGTNHSDIKTTCSSTTRFSQAKYYSYEDYKNGNYTYNKFMVIYDANLCDVAFDGKHTEPQDDGNCTTAVICSVCSDYTYKQAKSHINSERLTYTSFMQAGEYYVGCINDGCNVGTTEVLDALFTCLGYSANQYGDAGITVGYKVNKGAVSKYEKLSGTTVDYGVFAVSKNKLDGKDIFDEKGTSANGVISVELNFENDYFDMKVTNFTESNKDTKLAIGAYVKVTNENESAYSYLQAGTPSEGDAYVFVSYSELAPKQ